MDLDAGAWGISRDIAEVQAAGVFGYVALALTFGLPVASFVALLTRHRLALLPLALSSGLFALWFLYYATDWFAPTGQAAWMPALLSIGVGWLLLVAALVRPWRRGPLRELLDVRALLRGSRVD